MLTTKILQSALTEKVYAKAHAPREDSLKLAKHLESAGLQRASARTLAARLRHCRRDHRCGSLACPQCGKAGQALLASVTTKFTAGQADNLDIAFATIIPRNSSVPKGALHDFDLANFKRRLRDGLAKTSALCAVGAIDVTLNEHRNELFAAHWLPHAHLMIATNDIDTLKREMREAFPRSASASKPVVVKQWDGDPRVSSYIFAVDFDRRISIENSERFNLRTGQTRFCRATTYCRLRVSERIELALFLDTMGLGGRLVLRNARLYPAGKSVRLRLVSG